MGGFLGRRLELLQKSRLPLIGNVLKPLAKRVLKPLELTVASSATDAAFHKKMLGSGITKLIISNEKMNDIIKKALAKHLRMKQKIKKVDFLEYYLVH